MKRFSHFLFLFGLIGLYMSCLSFGSSRPPLYQAVLDGNLIKIKQLVEAGVDINKGAYGNTPLERASELGNLEIVEYLLSQGAQNPQTAFQRAMARRHFDVAKHFIDSGYIDINNNARFFYSILNDAEIPFDQRMQKVNDMANGKLNSPYLLALVQPENYQKMINFFNINLTDKADTLGNSILHIAAMRNNLDLVNYLLDTNFDVNVLDDNNQTALFYCITSFGPSIDWLNPVIENETIAKINYISDMPFYNDANGIQRRQATIGILLLDADINVNQQNKAGWTVLHFSCASYPAGPRETLIERGADQNIKTNFGRTAADIFALRR